MDGDSRKHTGAKQIKPNALSDAIREGNVEEVKILLNDSTETNISNSSANLIALALHNYECPTDLIQLLLSHGVSPNDHDERPDNIPLLCVRKARYGFSILKLLLEHGTNVIYRKNKGRFKVFRTPVYDYIRTGWIAGLKVLLEAGADPNDQGAAGDAPLIFAITRHRMHLIKILLEHGADPNLAGSVNLELGNFHSKRIYTTPLHEAARQGWTEMVRMLVEAGAKCITRDNLENPLVLVLQKHTFSWPLDLIGMLLKHGAVDCKVLGRIPLLHRLLECEPNGPFTFSQLERLLDMFFLQGGNINVEDDRHVSALEYVVCRVERIYMNKGHANSVRWLLRHGADIPCLSKEVFKTPLVNHLPIVMVLLQAGLRVSYAAQTKLRRLEAELSDSLHMDKPTELTPLQFEAIAVQGMHLEKTTFPEYCVKQMVDLLEFSDKSLHAYQEDTHPNSIKCQRQKSQRQLDHIQKVLKFLGEPQSLQWYCRRCIRESLVSLQPSVMKTLMIPSILKRYIMCHEI